MNAPISNYYDSHNAGVLVEFAAATYGGGAAGTECQPHQVIENADTDTRAVIYQAMEGDVVVAFRGTRSLRNFVTDVCARRVAPTSCGPSDAEVHEGFQWALDSVGDELCTAVERLAARADAPRLWVTGHSLGAALGKLWAWKISNLKFEISRGLAGVYTFGEPRVGNRAFCDCYDALLKSRTFRVVDGGDFIARIPWLLGAYRHCGTEIFYDNLGVRHASPFWWVKGASDVFGTWQEWRHDGRLALLNDHHVGRYVALLCGDGNNGKTGTYAAASSFQEL